MEITEVRIKLIGRRSDKLRAFCSITFDNAFVVRDLKIIEGQKGAFVAMPSRKICERCARCGCKNHLRAKFCNDCGNRLPIPPAAAPEADVRVKLHADIAHPINAASRESIQKRIIEAYAAEVEKSKLPGYKPVEIYESSEEYDL
ncbi:MAG: SpoVG family protein [Planctomycetaceae bacterium]|nr:SpoVG family protein [Planctomycetaceae bacterium]